MYHHILQNYNKCPIHNHQDWVLKHYLTSNNETNKELLDNSLTIVTWFYESAKQHYIEKQKIKDKIEEFNKLNSSMFQKSSSTVKVHRAIDNRKENILITEIDFNEPIIK